MADALSNGVDDVKELVVVAKGHGCKKNIGENEKEVSNTKKNKEVVENILHGPKNFEI